MNSKKRKETPANPDKKDKTLKIIKTLNGAVSMLNHIATIYPATVDAHQKINSTTNHKIDLIREIQAISQTENLTEKEIHKLSEEHAELPFFNISKKIKLHNQIERKKALLEHLQHTHTVHSSLVLVATDEIKKILEKYEYAGDPNLLIRKYNMIITYFYNPTVNKLNSLMGTSFPTKTPGKIESTPFFAVVDEPQRQNELVKDLGIEINM